MEKEKPIEFAKSPKVLKILKKSRSRRRMGKMNDEFSKCALFHHCQKYFGRREVDRNVS